MVLRLDSNKKNNINWFVRVNNKISNECKMKLFCFPYAGGGASIYQSWQDYLPEGVEVYSVQLPGRENRINESLYTDLKELLNDLTVSIQSEIDKPYAIFSHCSGSLLAYELCRCLIKKGLPLPVHLFVSGQNAPYLESEEIPLSELNDQDLIEKLIEIGELPDIILNEKGALEFFLPTIKADLKMIETYSFDSIERIDCPLTVFGSPTDPITSESGLRSWDKYTSNLFRLKNDFDGGHFFLRDNQQLLLNEIYNDLYGSSHI